YSGSQAGNGTLPFDFNVDASSLDEGTYSVKVSVTDDQGSTLPEKTLSFTVDTTAPDTPVIDSPGNGMTTSDATPTISGTAEANSTVTVNLDGTKAGTSTAD